MTLDLTELPLPFKAHDAAVCGRPTPALSTTAEKKQNGRARLQNTTQVLRHFRH
jgi:hypothetical protein